MIENWVLSGLKVDCILYFQDTHPSAETGEVEEDPTTESEMLSSQNEPETQPLNLENTPPLLFLDDSDDDESMWGWLHPSSSFNFQPLGNQSLPFLVLPICFSYFKTPSCKMGEYVMSLWDVAFLISKAKYFSQRGINDPNDQWR